MAQRRSLECSNSVISAFDFDDVADEPRQLSPNASTAPQNIANDENVSQALTSVEPDQSDSSISGSNFRNSKKHDQTQLCATVKKSTLREWSSTIFDILMSLVPLFFLVVAILCLSLDSKPMSAYGQTIKAITLLSPTIFPIIYAAILGKFLRRIGLFKAERSSTIGTLEQLIGSQSFFAAIERQFGLRRVNFLGIAIIAAWLLSPLGGQSSLRLLSTRPSQETVNETVKFLGFEGFKSQTVMGTQMLEANWAQWAPFYMTALQTSRLSFESPRDMFGNPRIPDISLLDSISNSSIQPFNWHPADSLPSLTYTSLLGVPVADIPRLGNVSLTVESSYWEVRCGFWSKGNSTKIHSGPGGQTFALDWSSGKELWPFTSNDRVKFSFNYTTKTSLGGQQSMTSCTATLRLVESRLNCVAAACSVHEMRHADRDVSYNFRRMGDLESHNSTPYWWYLQEYIESADLGPETTRSFASQLTERWMAYPGQVLEGPDEATNQVFVNLTTLAPEEFGPRLQMAMNTFWDATLITKNRIGNLTSASLGPTAYDEAIWNRTNATGLRHSGEEIGCNKTFAALTIVISFLLFVAAGISVTLGLVTRAPDILGYVSTLARDDPYFEKHIPSYLDGLAAAREIHDVRVIVGDVKQDADVGHVAFASLDIGPQRVSKKRLYD